ncbi:MAG: MBL fold metallo-hydrolase [Lapillicoccus sp.]
MSDREHPLAHDGTVATPWDPVYAGTAYASSRGALGWSAVLLGQTAGGRPVLFDTGGPGDRQTLPDRLRQRGLECDDVAVVVLSHLHFDHANNWDLFGRAEIIVGEPDLAHAEDGSDWAVLRDVIAPLRKSGRLRVVRGPESIDAVLDVVPAPGHTPGSIAVVSRGTVLCGDALKNRWQLAEALARPAAERDETETTIVDLATRAERLWPGHDSPLARRGGHWVPESEHRVRLHRPDGHLVWITSGPEG